MRACIHVCHTYASVHAACVSHTCTYTRIHTYIVRTCMYVCVCVCTYTLIHEYIFACISVLTACIVYQWLRLASWCRGWAESDRGVSFTFGADVVEKFNRKHDFDLIVRAHQVNMRVLACIPYTLSCT
jgi:hypothetical protein